MAVLGIHLRPGSLLYLKFSPQTPWNYNLSFGAELNGGNYSRDEKLYGYFRKADRGIRESSNRQVPNYFAMQTLLGSVKK